MPELSHVGIIPAPEGVDTPEWALRMACASGASYSEIGVKCGLTKDAACKRAKKMGISNRMGIEALGPYRHLVGNCESVADVAFEVQMRDKPQHDEPDPDKIYVNDPDLAEVFKDIQEKRTDKTDAADMLRMEGRLRRLADQNIALRRREREVLRIDGPRDVLTRAFNTDDRGLVYEPLRTPKRASGKKAVALIVHLTDWHAFERVRISTVMGMNELTGNIMCDRIQSVVEQTIRRIDELSLTYDIVEVTILWGGDFASGMIHELDRYSEGNPIEVCVNTSRLLARSTNDITNHCHRLGIPTKVTGVPGNHGRLRADTSYQNLQAPTESFDWLIMHNAADKLDGSEIKNVFLPDSLFSVFETMGQRDLLVHGDFLCKGSTPPARALRTLEKYQDTLKVTLNSVYFGHFHNLSSMDGRAFGTPSLKGGDGYALAVIGANGLAAQCLYVVHEDGHTDQQQILATNPITDSQYRERWSERYAEPVGAFAGGHPYVMPSVAGR